MTSPELRLTRPPLAGALTQALAACLLGLAGAPSLLTSGLDHAAAPGRLRLEDGIWLTVSALAVAWLLAVTPRLALGLETVLSRTLGLDHLLTARRPAVRLNAGAVSRWLIAAGCVVVGYAILRRPLMLVLGVPLDRSSVEAVFAAGSLCLLLLILFRLHRVAHPILEELIWAALDATIPTVDADSVRDGELPRALTDATDPYATPPTLTIPHGRPE